jgi:hypothetical protein
VTGRHALDGASFDTSDGRIVRLPSFVPGPDAQGALERLVAGKPLSLRPLSRPADRWGRLLAHADTGEPSPRSLEAVLLTEGLGHAAAAGRAPCLAPLLAAEATAREDRKGIWSTPAPALVTDTAGLAARMGEHIVTEGTVVSARALRGRVYLNFARYWRSGLSLVIAERDWPAMAGGASPESLVGRRIRARGWLEWRGGPAIVANVAEPIEPVDGRALAVQEK